MCLWCAFREYANAVERGPRHLCDHDGSRKRGCAYFGYGRNAFIAGLRRTFPTRPASIGLRSKRQSRARNITRSRKKACRHFAASRKPLADAGRCRSDPSLRNRLGLISAGNACGGRRSRIQRAQAQETSWDDNQSGRGRSPISNSFAAPKLKPQGKSQLRGSSSACGHLEACCLIVPGFSFFASIPP